MSTMTFDTFKSVDRLEKAGMTREQAAAIVEAQKDAFSEALDTSSATKADIVRVGGDKGGADQRRFYKRLISIADSRFDEHLVDLKANLGKCAKNGKKT